MKGLLGKKAPEFILTDKNGTPHSLQKMDYEFVVLFFYPKDSTPGCTLEAKGFSNALKSFEKHNALVVGISGGG